jgi:alcohol dehydrogenase class IV
MFRILLQYPLLPEQEVKWAEAPSLLMTKLTRKEFFFSPKLLAKIVFADPLLTMELPSFITAATGMDALTHNMEAFLAKTPHPMCEGIALEGMSLIAQSLEQAVKKPDIESRSKMLIASLMGAVAFQKGLVLFIPWHIHFRSLLDTHHGLAMQ